MNRFLTITLAAGLLVTANGLEAQAKKAGVKFKDLSPDLQQVVLQEVNKFSRQDLVELYLEKATPRDLLVIINASGHVTRAAGAKQ